MFDVDGDQQGNWTIHCFDTADGGGTGTLNQWSLHFTPRGDPSADCDTNGVPDACDIEQDDCNTNNAVDACEELFPFSSNSGDLAPFDREHPQSYALLLAPVALTDVVLTFSVIADLNSDKEYFSVDLDGTPVGDLFVLDGNACPGTPDVGQIVVPADTFNAAALDGSVVINMIPADDVSPSCMTSRIAVSVTYDAPVDCNANDVPDACDVLPPNPNDYVETPNLVFQDNDVEITDTISIATPTGFIDVNVDLVITYPFMGDTIHRLDKDGLTIALMDHLGLDSNNCDILFDDEASGAPPFLGPLFGTFTPLESLSAFDADGGQQGNWTIHCQDTISGSGSGVLNQWSLHFTPTGDIASADCNTNGAPDECDIAGGRSDDANGNGVPDECEAVLCPTCPGDTNGDTFVDGDDVPGFVACLLTGTGCACSDVDGDGQTADADAVDDLSMFVDKLLSDPTLCP